MRVEYINPFIAATKHVFETVAGCTVHAEPPELGTREGTMYDVSGIIGLSGGARGSVVISFPKDVALSIVTEFAGIESKCLDDDFCDAIGELANMVAGNAKKDLEGLNVSISIPSVILGRNHRIVTERKTPCICVPFVCDHGRFAIEVGLVTDDVPASVGAQT